MEEVRVSIFFFFYSQAVYTPLSNRQGLCPALVDRASQAVTLPIKVIPKTYGFSIELTFLSCSIGWYFVT